MWDIYIKLKSTVKFWKTIVVDENSALYTWLCIGVIAGVQHIDGPLQVKYWSPDPCRVGLGPPFRRAAIPRAAIPKSRQSSHNPNPNSDPS